MATAVLPNNDSLTNTNDEHLEIFSLIWLDANLTDTRHTEQKLRSIINHLRKFQEVQQFQQFIKQTTQNDRLVLIVSGQMGQEIVPSIHHLRQVISIYIYCMDKKTNEEWFSTYKKVKGVFVDLNELISRIQTDYKFQKKVDEPLSINIFTTPSTNSGKSTEGINGRFVFSQILLDCLLQLKSTDIDKNELISLCKKQYEGNLHELRILQEFEKEYSSDKALWWYTRETFLYKTLNAALRAQNIHMIFLYRGFISDIYHHLQRNQTQEAVRVYRSQLMSSAELDGLKQHIGQFTSINSLFSTSIDQKKALFNLGDTSSPSDLERVLFEIDADPKAVTTKPFADIKAYSDFPDESEVLFMLGSIFRLDSIAPNGDQIWVIRMTLCNDSAHDLKQVLIYMKQQIGSGKMNLPTLGKVLLKMGKLDLAEKYFNRVLEERPSNKLLLRHLYEGLGELASLREDYNLSVDWHRKSLLCKNKRQSSANSNIDKRNKLTETQVISCITNNKRWKQHGITVAGGNEKGNKLNQLRNPLGLSIDNDQQTIYIADCDNHRIVEWKFNAKTGQVIAGGNGKGNQMNQLYCPSDVLVDTKNNSLIICDNVNRRVVEWSRENGTKNGQILISDIDCFGITMDKNGYIYVSDTKKNEVRRWKRGETNGTIVAGGNGKGKHLNQLNSPRYLFVDQDDSLYISDIDNYRVMKWMKDAKEGIIVAGGQRKGDKLTQLYYPHGVFVDHLGNVYVADFGNNRIMCWSKGSTQGSIVVGGNGEGKQSNQLHYPRGISFDREDNLYVVDQYNNRIQKFEIDKY